MKKPRATPQKGTCRYCGCTFLKPCYPPCCWIDRAQTVCSATLCYQQAIDDGVKLVKGAALLGIA